jgi:hypothetical protein
MNNNDSRHPAQQVSGPNKYLQLARATKCPLAIYFNDGEVIPSCILLEVDTLNVLVKTVDLDGAKPAGEEFVITRASIRKIGSSLEHNHNR